MNGGIVIVNTSLVSAGSSRVTAQDTWNGGQGVLVLAAQGGFAATVSLVLVGVGKENQTVKVNSGNLSASGIYPIMLPAGRYAIDSTAGSSVGLYAALMPTP